MATDLEDLRAWGTGCGSRGYELTHSAANEIERLRAPITMQDIRLHAGEGKLSPHTILQAANIVLRAR